MINFLKKHKNHPALLPLVNLKKFFERNVLGNSMLELISYRLKGYYNFRFKYFDKWAMLKLKRYINWQLPYKQLKVSILGACVDEYKALYPTFTKVLDGKDPKVAMDFACGLGRSSIFFMRMLNWRTNQVYFCRWT